MTLGTQLVAPTSLGIAIPKIYGVTSANNEGWASLLETHDYSLCSASAIFWRIDDKMGASSYKRPWIAAKALPTAVSAPLWPYGLGRLQLATCERKMWVAQLESDGQEHQDLLYKRACRGPRSTQTHPPTRHALHPHLEAPPRPSSTSGPRFQPAPGCQQARIAQPSHLTYNNRIRRARGPGATRRPSQRDRGRL